MFPALTLIIILAFIILWFLLSFLFPSIGGFTKKLYDDAIYNMSINKKKKRRTK